MLTDFAPYMNGLSKKSIQFKPRGEETTRGKGATVSTYCG